MDILGDEVMHASRRVYVTRHSRQRDERTAKRSYVTRCCRQRGEQTSKIGYVTKRRRQQGKRSYKRRAWQRLVEEASERHLRRWTIASATSPMFDAIYHQASRKLLTRLTRSLSRRQTALHLPKVLCKKLPRITLTRRGKDDKKKTGRKRLKRN